MYNGFKNEFISEMYSMNINLNGDQMGKILTTLDITSEHYDIFSKSQLKCSERCENGVPLTVYNYIDSKRAEGRSQGTLYIYRLMLEVSSNK